MTDVNVLVARNAAEVRGRIAEAALRSGRSADQVRLVAVTKYVGPDEVRALVAAGCTQLGESRPQQLCEKAESLHDLPIRWHMIGHLQRNKIRRTLPRVELIQSANNGRLVTAIDRVAGELGLRVPILLEVNTSGESAKHGFDPTEIEPVLPDLAALANVEVRGLMCMAGLRGDADSAREDFASLRRLRDSLREACPPGITLDELSMGMSGDYEMAIEEGATIVRVGSALFRGVL